MWAFKIYFEGVGRVYGMYLLGWIAEGSKVSFFRHGWCGNNTSSINFCKYVQYFTPNGDFSLTGRIHSDVHWELRLRRSVSK